VSSQTVQELLGAPDYVRSEIEERKMEPGVSVGLAWTPVGGEILFVETTLMRGGKNLTLTGQLGEVMRESAQASLSYIRSNAAHLDIDPEFFQQNDLHVHVPAGAIPKDGPSAGVAMLVSMVSLLTGRPINAKLAMTGEITLHGQVLPVGGIKEKVLGAYRAGVRTIILPKRNEKDVVEDVPEEIREAMAFHYVGDAEEALALALQPRKCDRVPAKGKRTRQAEKVESSQFDVA
jgi:ATP-dependent Lon protease